jgi:hypothetical protein
MPRLDGPLPLVITLLATLLGSAFTPDARAQMFSYGGDRPRSVQSVSFAYKIVDFNFDGEAGEEETFEFAGPAYGVFYSRPNVSASITYGPKSEESARDLRLLDAAITTWGELVLTGSPGSHRLFVPIAIQSNYRRVAPRGSENSIIDSFNLTVLGLGVGLGFSAEVRESARLEGRVLPTAGLALRAFGDSAGSSYLLDTDLRLHLMDLVGRLGLSAGYGFRLQAWNVDGSDLLLGGQEDLLDYSGTQHVLTIGLNW